MKNYQKIIIAYLAIVFLKILITYFIKSPLAYADSYIYMGTAKSVFYDQTLLIDGINTLFYPPLYPIILSISYIFSNMGTVFFIMKMINAIIISTSILPIYLLAKEYLNEKNAIYTAILGSIIPPLFSFHNYILSENLFYPLILFTIYFIYKTFTQNTNGWAILSGIFLGLCYLTKINAIVLIPVILVIGAYKVFKKEQIITKLIILFCFSLIIISPWIITNILNNGFSIQGILGFYTSEIPNYETEYNIFSGIYWTILYGGYLIISTYIIFFILTIILILQQNEKRLNNLIAIIILTVIFSIIIAGIHSGQYSNWKESHSNGRYIEYTIPLILILGTISLERGFLKNWTNKYSILTFIFLLITLPLLKFKLLPVNNMSLSLIGAITKISSTNLTLFILSILIILSPLYLQRVKRIEINKLKSYILISIIVLSIINTSIIFYDSNYKWLNKEESQFGKWINNNIDPTTIITFDERDYHFSKNRIKKDSELDPTYILSWVRNKVKSTDVKNANTKYIISTYKLNHKIITNTKTLKNNIYIYEV